VKQLSRQSPQAAEAHNDKLVELLQARLPWHLARIKCFAMLVLGLLESTTVSLYWLAQTGTSKVQSDSGQTLGSVLSD
jgi:hypothetical protein